MQTTAVPISPIVRKIMRWVEWLLLIHCIAENFFSVRFDALPGAYWRLGIFLLVIGALSLKLPTHATLRQRRLYIAVEMLIITLARFARLSHSMLFELFILKACLLLHRRDVLITTLISGSVFFIQLFWLMPIEFEEVRTLGVEPFLNPWTVGLSNFISIVTVCIFVVLFGSLFASEQRSRRRAEVLATEVEALATKLERARIARDIHDSLGHSLTTLDVQLALAQRYSQTDPDKPKLQRSLTTAQQLAAQCLNEVRQSLQTIRDSNFELESALTTLSDQMQPYFSIEREIKLPQLPQQLSYQLYLIAKEGLINIQKHAQATRARLSLVTTENQLVLTLVDNGCGFDVNASRSGYGLQGIKERSQLVGGQLTVNSHPEQGTHLCVKVPIVASSSPKEQPLRQEDKGTRRQEDKAMPLPPILDG